VCEMRAGSEERRWGVGRGSGVRRGCRGCRASNSSELSVSSCEVSRVVDVVVDGGVTDDEIVVVVSLGDSELGFNASRRFTRRARW
jgi:hypothetical protein